MPKCVWRSYGMLCLEYSKEHKQIPRPARYLVKVDDTIIADFDAIQKVMPLLRKAKMTSEEEAMVESARKGLTTDLAKSIVKMILAKTTAVVSGTTEEHR